MFLHRRQTQHDAINSTVPVSGGDYIQILEVRFLISRVVLKTHKRVICPSTVQSVRDVMTLPVLTCSSLAVRCSSRREQRKSPAHNFHRISLLQLQSNSNAPSQRDLFSELYGADQECAGSTELCVWTTSSRPKCDAGANEQLQNDRTPEGGRSRDHTTPPSTDLVLKVSSLIAISMPLLFHPKA